MLLARAAPSAPTLLLATATTTSSTSTGAASSASSSDSASRLLARLQHRPEQQLLVQRWQRRRRRHAAWSRTSRSSSPPLPPPQALWGTRRASGGGEASDRSEAVNEELLVFFFQMDLNAQLQKALNTENFQLAAIARRKMAEFEVVAARSRAKKQRAAQTRITMTESAEQGLLLRSQLQRAIEQEDYAEAARIRDQLNALEAASMATEAANAIEGIGRSFKYRLGQKFTHKTLGYRGVVCGMDPSCFENEEWVARTGTEELTFGRKQPFYQALVQTKDLEYTVAYVAEELIEVPDKPDKEKMEHPYIYLLFYGMDGSGNYIPTKPLREKYNAPRYDDDPDSNSQMLDGPPKIGPGDPTF
eukprot:jgi/Chlat1/1655/Chrsp127S01952